MHVKIDVDLQQVLQELYPMKVGGSEDNIAKTNEMVVDDIQINVNKVLIDVY